MNRYQIAFGLLFVVVFAQSRTVTQSGQPRLVLSLPGTPIIEKLRPDDTHVEVQRGDIISVFVDDRARSLAQDLDERVQFADAIAIVEPRASNSYLVENGEWIRTKLELHTIRNLKERAPPIFDRDGNTTVEHDGGEVFIKGVRVRAGGYLLFTRGERYLVSLKALSNGKIALVGMQFRITADDRIARIYLPDGREASAASALYGLSLKQFEEEVRSRLKR